MNPNYNFERIQTQPNIRVYQKKASTAFSKGQLCAIDSNGFLIPATAVTAAADHVGVILRDVVSTDSDYATAADVMVDCARKGDRGDWFYAQVGTGTPAQTHVGETHDLTSAGKVDLTANSVNAVKVERIISSTVVAVTVM